MTETTQTPTDRPADAPGAHPRLAGVVTDHRVPTRIDRFVADQRSPTMVCYQSPDGYDDWRLYIERCRGGRDRTAADAPIRFLVRLHAPDRCPEVARELCLTPTDAITIAETWLPEPEAAAIPPEVFENVV